MRMRGLAMPLAALALAPAAATAMSVQIAGFVAVTTGTGTMQISSFKVDGSHERRLTAGPANHHYPSVSPDGRWLLYTGESVDGVEIYRLDLSNPSAPPLEVTAPPLSAEAASWSPDGRTILYTAILLGRPVYSVFAADADGQHVRQLTHSIDSGSAQPVFSPDGRRIAYISGRAREDSIWVMNADGSDPRVLTAGPRDAYPAWLDDSTVLFAREDPATEESSVMSVTLDGIESVVSPAGVSLIEPSPRPGGGGYAATEVLDGALRLVMVSGSSVAPIALPSSDGSTLSLSWIVAQPASAKSSIAWLPFLVGAGGLAGLSALTLTLSRRRRERETHRQTSVC